MNWFNNLSIKYKIGAIALIGVLALVTSLAVNYRLISNVKGLLNRTIEAQMPTLQFLNELQVGFAEIKDLYQAAIIASDQSSLDAANNNVKLLMSQFYDMRSRTVYHEAKLETLIDALKRYTDAISKQTELVLSGADIASPEMVAGFAKADQLREEYEELQKAFISEWEHDFKNDLLTIQANESKILGGGTVIGLIAFIFLAFFSVLIIRQITRVLGNAVTVADKIAGGDLQQDIEVLAQDESGQLMNSLRVMRDSLLAQQQESQQRNDLQNALAGLNETMRGDQDIDVLAANITEYLASSTKSCIGAFYLLQDNKLKLLASYAFTLRRGGDHSFEVGESLVGQCALERKTFIVTDLPPDYVQVMSGLGQATPTSLIVFPVEQDGQLLGVIELGSFRRFGAPEMEFIEKGRAGVAIAINSAQARVRMAEMLQQTRIQAEELKLQQDQMKAINAELEERSQALDRQKNEVLQKNNELERSKKVLLEKSKALEASDRYKTQFLSTMSHELRTPLNSILILSQALIENKKGNLSEKEVQHAHVIHSSGSDLLTLINDILDLSKIEEGKLDLVYEETSLKNFAAELNKRFEFVAGNKGLEFKVTVADDMPPTVITDTHRLNQVLKNFISNAIKFTEKGGVYIDIHRPRGPFVPVQSMLSQKDCFVIAVRDTGIGIPKDKQEIIFEAFKQADGTTSRKYGGTGLGLTISRELASLLGGEISVHSEGDGTGSTFYVILPFDSSKGAATQSANLFDVEKARASEPAMEEQTDSSASSHSNLDKAAILAMFEQSATTNSVTDFGNSHFSQAQKVDRILIVEDDEKFAHILDELIQEAGLSCDLVHTGEDAFSYLELFRPQAVILDISLPDISGWDVLKKIKASLKAQSIPVHIVSAMPEKQQALQRGAEDFTEKPVSQDDVEDLLAKIKEEIGGNFNRVLLVEDNVALHEAITEQFAQKGINLHVVATGAEGIHSIKQGDYDCLIVDLMLPDMDGIDLLSTIRQLPGYGDKPIIVFTAQEMSAEREFEISKYSDRVIIKSGQAMDRLVSTVSKFIDNVPKGVAAPTNPSPSPVAAPAPSRASAPAATTAALAPLVEEAQYHPGDLDGCKVLLVDDDIRNIYSLSSVLETNNMEVITAMSGLEALDKLQQHAGFEVVLMDIMMPDMDGYETMRRIRAGQHCADIPIIALTAKAMKEDRDLCLSAGASDYLAKPVDTDRLNRLLVTWTRRSRKG